MAAPLKLKQICRELSSSVDQLSFGPPITHVYNPLGYARAAVEKYLDLAGEAPKEVVFLGMNPGPWGMAQTGVPFGTVSAVRDWMHIDAAVERPPFEHPKRPVLGLDVPREEVSGERFWGWARERFETPEKFFSRFFVANYCPLLFLEASGRNRTPDRLKAGEREALSRVCDAAFRGIVAVLQPKLVIGVGRFAQLRARAALGKTSVRIGGLLHPSPASPAANRGWQEQAENQLSALGVRGCGGRVQRRR